MKAIAEILVKLPLKEGQDRTEGPRAGPPFQMPFRRRFRPMNATPGGFMSRRSRHRLSFARSCSVKRMMRNMRRMMRNMRKMIRNMMRNMERVWNAVLQQEATSPY